MTKEVGVDMQKERHQYLSRPDVQVYLWKYPDVTAAEKRDLLKWLKSGQSPASNDCYLYDDCGYPLDFIDARRTELDLIQQRMQHQNEPEQPNSDFIDDSYELPF